MTEPIQVRPGRWRMRNGEVVNWVVPTNVPSNNPYRQWRWEGRAAGGRHLSWTDAGRYDSSECAHRYDLVQFLGEPEQVDLQREVERLKAGDFTEEEFQNLCHNLDADDLERFGKGCHEYQRKLFGKSYVDHDGWIPIDPAIGGRLPTEEDGRACGGCFLLTRKDGSVSREYTLAFTSAVLLNGDAVAWMPDPLPKPFVPPAKAEEPKRREFTNVTDVRCADGTYCCYVEADGHLREVLPGDVDPDAARRLVEDVNWTLVLDALRDSWGGTAPLSLTTLEDRLAACRRKESSENVR